MPGSNELVNASQASITLSMLLSFLSLQTSSDGSNPTIDDKADSVIVEINDFTKVCLPSYYDLVNYSCLDTSPE
ncbi:hypothetical protein GW17_00009884 [Ensete ventricosum]|nr:hypothetical protein GW17_00009884 [Ensete ventricosum]